MFLFIPNMVTSHQRVDIKYLLLIFKVTVKIWFITKVHDDLY